MQLFLERERAAVLAEAQADDIISEAPKSQVDESGQWQVTRGEMQWVASENNTEDKKEKEEEEEELDFNKGTHTFILITLYTGWNHQVCILQILLADVVSECVFTRATMSKTVRE